MDRVCEDRDAIIITRKRQQSVVMMSLEDFEALQETAYLLRSPKNAKRLLDALSTSLAEEGEAVQMADLRSEVLDSGQK